MQGNPISSQNYCQNLLYLIIMNNATFRYANDGHLLKEWMESTREIADVSSAAVRAATYVSKLKVFLKVNRNNIKLEWMVDSQG